MNKFFLPCIIAAIVVAACQSNETGKSKDVSQDQIHRSYEVIIDEAASTASASAVFRFAGENGTTLVLSKPSKVTANGNEMLVDSLLFGGAYYRSSADFSCPGNRVEISFTDAQENTLNETFEAGVATFTENPDTLLLGKHVTLSFTYSGGEKAKNFELVVSDAGKRSLSFMPNQMRKKCSAFLEVLPIRLLRVK